MRPVGCGVRGHPGLRVLGRVEEEFQLNPGSAWVIQVRQIGESSL